MVKTCNTRETHVIIRVPAVIKTWGDAVRRESLGVCLGQSTVIGRALRVGITVNSVCLAAYHWQMDFSVLKQCLGSAHAVLRQCFSSGTAADGHTPYKARPSQNWPKITTYDHVHQIFITSCTWFRRGVLCDRGLRQPDMLDRKDEKTNRQVCSTVSMLPSSDYTHATLSPVKTGEVNAGRHGCQ